MTETPHTLVRAARYDGSLEEALARDTKYGFVSVGNADPERRFAYCATPSPHCVMVVRHRKEYAEEHLVGRNVSLTVTGYDVGLLERVLAGLIQHTGIAFSNALPPALSRFMEASMNSSFPFIVRDPDAFREIQQTK